MESVPKEVWWMIFRDVLSVDILLVCRKWHDIVAAMPPLIVSQYVTHLFRRMSLNILVDYDAPDNVREPPFILYEKMLFDHKILLPNTPLFWGNEKYYKCLPYLSYRGRLAWPDVFDWIVAGRRHLRVRARINTIDEYFAFSYSAHEQFRYYLATTFPVDPRHNAMLAERLYQKYTERATIRRSGLLLWDYYLAHNIDAVIAITVEWDRFSCRP